MIKSFFKPIAVAMMLTGAGGVYATTTNLGNVNSAPLRPLVAVFCLLALLTTFSVSYCLAIVDLAMTSITFLLGIPGTGNFNTLLSSVSLFSICRRNFV